MTDHACVVCGASATHRRPYRAEFKSDHGTEVFEGWEWVCDDCDQDDGEAYPEMRRKSVSYQQEHEKKVICGDCNAYLYSRDHPDLYPEPLIVKCPCKLDPLGKCLGVLRDRPSASRT